MPWANRFAHGGRGAHTAAMPRAGSSEPDSWEPRTAGSCAARFCSDSNGGWGVAGTQLPRSVNTDLPLEHPKDSSRCSASHGVGSLDHLTSLRVSCGPCPQARSPRTYVELGPRTNQRFLQPRTARQLHARVRPRLAGARQRGDEGLDGGFGLVRLPHLVSRAEPPSPELDSLAGWYESQAS